MESVRVMVVDDAADARFLISLILRDAEGVELVGLKGEMRHAMLGVGGVQPRDVDEVRDDRGRRRLRPRARAVVHRRADG